MPATSGLGLANPSGHLTSVTLPRFRSPAAGSYYLNYTRIGVLVLLVHDASDIGVDAQKLVQYTKLRAKRGFFLSEVRPHCAPCLLLGVGSVLRHQAPHARVWLCAQTFFIANMLSYFYLLLYILPFHIIRCSFITPVYLVRAACSFPTHGGPVLPRQPVAVAAPGV